jgi:hypothetical protein
MVNEITVQRVARISKELNVLAEARSEVGVHHRGAVVRNHQLLSLRIRRLLPPLSSS